jgi:cysteine-rich repeat protein
MTKRIYNSKKISPSEKSKSKELSYQVSMEHPIKKHTRKVTQHLHKNHKSYLIWSILVVLGIKLVLVYLWSNWFTLAQNQEYTIGNGIIEQPYEECDDMNIENRDWCSENWKIENWYICDWQPSTCTNSEIDTEEYSINKTSNSKKTSEKKEKYETKLEVQIPPNNETIENNILIDINSENSIENNNQNETLQEKPQNSLDQNTTENQTVIILPDNNTPILQEKINIKKQFWKKIPLDQQEQREILTYNGVATVSDSRITQRGRYNLDLPIKINGNKNIAGSLVISGVQTLLVSWAEWNGKISWPELLSNQDSKAAKRWDTGISPQDKIIQTIKVWNANTDLVPEQWNYVVNVEVLAGKAGDRFDLRHSLDGQKWWENSMNKSCILDADYICSFKTKKLWYFALIQEGGENISLLDSSFRNSNPDQQTIINTVFGYPWKQSEYTQFWQAGSSCPINNIKISYIMPGQMSGKNIIQIPKTQANTIYILPAGEYELINPMQITSPCTALIGQGKVTLSSQKRLAHFIDIQASRVILDNISFNGKISYLKSDLAIKSMWNQNITLNNLEIYNMERAVYIEGSENISIFNSKIFSNTYSIILENTQFTLLHNNLIFHNYRWLNLQNTQNSSINNSQFFNNHIGIYASNSSNNLFNNTTIYSNHTGLRLQNQSNNIRNNSFIYNNQVIADVNDSENNSYHGVFKIFGNERGEKRFTSLTLKQAAERRFGNSVLEAGRIESNETYNMCDWVSNIKYYYQYSTSKGIESWDQYLLPMGSCKSRWPETMNPIFQTDSYTFGINIPRQSAVLWYANTNTLKEITIAYRSDLALGENQSESKDKVILPTIWDPESLNTLLREKWGFKAVKKKNSSSTILEWSAAIDLSRSKGKLKPAIIHTSDPSSINQVRVTFPWDTVLKTKGAEYAWTLHTPRYLSKEEIQTKGFKNIIAAVELGDRNTSINFEDENGNIQEVEVEMELPKGLMLFGDSIEIKYSEAGGEIQDFKKAKIIDLWDNKKGVRFTTRHFSTYYNIPGGLRWYMYSPIDNVRITWGWAYFQFDIYDHFQLQNVEIVKSGWNYIIDPARWPYFNERMNLYSDTQGNHAWKLYIIDELNWWGLSNPWEYYRIDDIAPSINFTTPAAWSWFRADGIGPNFTISDATAWIHSCERQIKDNGTIVQSRSTNDIYNWCAAGFVWITTWAWWCNTEGVNMCTIEMRARDNAGNLSSVESRSFSYDKTPPSSSVTSPAEGGCYSGDISAVISDTDNLWLTECYARIINMTHSGTASRTCNSTFTMNSSNCPNDGTCIFSWRAFDQSYNRTGWSTRSRNIDRTGPTLQQLNWWTHTTSTPTLTWEHATNSDWCWVDGPRYTGTIYSGSDVCGGSSTQYFDLTTNANHTVTTPLPNGTHSYRIRATDMWWNWSNTSPCQSFTVSYDSTPPTIANGSAIYDPTNWVYGIWTVISIFIPFDEDIVVTWTPTLTLNTTPINRTANYVWLYPDGHTAIFTYTVQAWDTSPDLDWLNTNALSLAWWTIKDAAGNNAILTLPSPWSIWSLSYWSDVIIDTTPPTMGWFWIYAWNYNWVYYNWTITLRQIVNDTNWISSCQYSIDNWNNRNPGTTGAGCFANNIAPWVSFTGIMRAYDTAGNLGTWSPLRFIYDSSAPIYQGTTPFAWRYSGNLVATFNYSDPGVGPISLSTECTITTEWIWVQCSISNPNMCDDLGNCNVNPVSSNSANIDKTPPPTPTITAEPTYTPWTSNTVTSSTVLDWGVWWVQYQFCRNTSNTTIWCTSSTRWSNNTTFNSLSDWQIYYYFVRSTDSLWNTSSRSTSTNSIQDNTPPTVSIPSFFASEYNYMTRYKSGSIFAASASDSNWISSCEYTINNWSTRNAGNRNAGNCESILVNPQSDFTGNTRVYDIVGNIWTGSPQRFYYDQTPPNTPTLASPLDWITISSTTPTLQRNGTMDTGIWLEWYYYQLSTGNTFAIIVYQGTWSSISRIPWTLTDGNTYYWRVRAHDYLRNTSNFSPIRSFTVNTVGDDTTAPVGISISINSWDPATNNPATTITLSASDNIWVTQMQFSCNNTNRTNPEAYNTSKSFNITNQSQAWCTISEWTKTVYVKFGDAANNRSDTINDTIILDATPPTAPNISCTIYPNNMCTQNTSSSTCVITSTTRWPSALSWVQYSTGGSWINIGTTTWFTFTPPEWTTNIIMRVSDFWGRSSDSNTYVIQKDTTPPNTPVPVWGTFPNVTPTLTRDVPSGWGCDTTISSYQVLIYSDAICSSSVYGDSAPTNNYTIPWGILNTGNTYYYTLKARDGLGNESTTSACIAFSIQEWDVIPPSVWGAELYAGNYYGNYFNGAIGFRATATDANGIASCRYSTNGGSTRSAGTFSAGYCQISSVSPWATFDWRLAASDPSNNAWTWSSTTFTYDATAPYLSGYSAINIVNRYSGDQSQTFTYTDAGVGGSWTNPSCTITTEGDPANCTISNPNICDYLNNCNTTSVTSSGIKLDKTKPQFLSTTSFAWWYSGNQIATFTYTDALAWIFSQSSNTCTIITEWVGQTCTAIPTAIDNAGNSTWSIVRTSNPANIDKTNPTTTISDTNNWWRGNNVISTLNCIDTTAWCNNSYYKILNEDVACDTEWYTTYVDTIQVIGQESMEETKTVCFYSIDNAWNKESTKKQVYKIDKQSPSIPNTTSPISWTTLPTNNVTLRRSNSDDTGIGISGYYYQISTDPTFASLFDQWTGINNTVNINSLVDWNTYYRRIRAFDQFYNTSSRSNQSNFTIDTLSSNPIVGPAFISNWLTWFNWWNLYYKWIIDISASVNDPDGIFSCEYNTWAWRSLATYDWSANCYQNWLNYSSNLTISFRVQDNLWNISISSPNTYYYDDTAPTFTFNNASWPECQAWTLEIMSPNDSWVWIHSIPYSFSGGWDFWSRQINSNYTIGALNTTWTVQIDAKVRDKLSNESISYTAIYTFTNEIISANNFSYPTDILSWEKTFNWQTLSSAAAWSCETISAIIQSNGTKWNCSIIGNNMTYTPNQNQTWSDSCTITISDGDTNIIRTVTVNNIDTLPPTIAITNPDTLPSTGKIILASIDDPMWTLEMTELLPAGSPCDDSQTFTPYTTKIANQMEDNGKFICYKSIDQYWNQRYQASAIVQWIDTQAPTIETGWIYIGITWYNSPNYYYKWTISIQSSGNDNEWIDQTSCQYTTWTTREPADRDNINWRCYKNWLTPNDTIVINFRVKDLAGNLGTWAQMQYNYDNSTPTIPSTSSPASWTILTTTNTTLQRSASTDGGIGISGYYYQISTDPTFASLFTQWTGINNTVNINSLVDWTTYYWRVRAFDQFYNTSSRSNQSIFAVNTSSSNPTVESAFISNWLTWSNGSNLYYKWTIDIRATVNDPDGIDPSSCEYSTWISRTSATYDWSANCYQNWLNYSSNITISFRVSDNLWNTWAGGQNTYLYDNTPPTFNFTDSSWPECQAWSLSINNPNDSWIGLHSAPYSFDWSTRNNTNTNTIPSQQPGTQNRTARIRDLFLNSWSSTATYTFTNTPPTANNFSYSSNVWSTAKTTNRKTESNATEGSCWNTDLIFNAIISQGTKWSCSVVWDNISYTPNQNQTWSDSCTIQIRDNEGSTTNFTVTRNWISTAWGCWDGIIAWAEQCDDWNTNNWDGCLSTCQFETPNCNRTLSIHSWSVPLSVIFTWIKNIRATYTLNLWTGWNISAFSLPFTWIYNTTWTFIYSIQWYNNLQWGSTTTCSQVWEITVGDWSQTIGIFWWPTILGTIPRIRRAQIEKAYMSDPFTIINFNGNQLARVDKGTIYVNGTWIWQTGYVKNWDEIQIQLYSSKDYDTTVSSKITIWERSATFYITTITKWEDNTRELSTLQKIRIMTIFNTLMDLYKNNPEKQQEFLYTFRSMINDKLKLLNPDDDSYPAFEYLLGLIDAHLLLSPIDESNHIAPNCKEYRIRFNSDKKAYYSPDYKTVYYFSTRESLIRYTDYKNAGDCRINTYWTNDINTTNTGEDLHIAPNGKIYNIESTNSGYTSQDLLTKQYFDSIQWLRDYINIRNPRVIIRDHEIDTSFDILTYTAPNGKIYKIYKTDRGYMSYKLMEIKYYPTLESLQIHIDKNNKI